MKNGGYLEVLGGYVNFAGQHSEQNPDIINEDANVSYIGTNFMSRTHWKGIWEIRGTDTTKFVNEDFPDRITNQPNNYFVPLYVGYTCETTPVTTSLPGIEGASLKMVRTIPGGVRIMPSNDHFTRVVLFTAQGRNAGRFDLGSMGHVDLHLRSGVYLLRFVSTRKTYAERIVVRK